MLIQANDVNIASNAVIMLMSRAMAVFFYFWAHPAFCAGDMNFAIDIESKTGTIDMENFSIHFHDSGYGPYDFLAVEYKEGFHTDISRSDYAKQAGYEKRVLGAAMSSYPDGSPRAYIYCSTDKSANRSEFRDPVLNYAVLYCLDGEIRVWSIDGKVCYHLYFKNNRFLGDSCAIGNRVYGFGLNDREIEKYPIEFLLYDPVHLKNLQAEMATVKKPDGKAGKVKFDYYNYVYADFEIDSAEQRILTYRKCSTIINDYINRNDYLSLDISFTNGTITDFGIVEDLAPDEKGLAPCEKEILLEHFRNSFHTVEITVNDMKATNGILSVYFSYRAC
jgi:hypothetical protein